MKKNIMNLEEKIYLLLYGQPTYKANISKIIYGKEVKTITRYVDKLEDNKWIKKVSLPNFKVTREKYYHANMKPLFDSILWDLEEKNISLTPNENKNLKKYLDSKYFRKIVYDIVIEDGRLRNPNIDFSTIKTYLVYDSTYAIFVVQWMEGRIFRASFTESLMVGKTYPIFFSLGTSLCEKLTHLDSYTSSVIYSSFEDVRDMIESTFKPVLKDYMIKVDGDAREKILKKISKKNKNYLF